MWDGSPPQQIDYLRSMWVWRHTEVGLYGVTTLSGVSNARIISECPPEEPG